MVLGLRPATTSGGAGLVVPLVWQASAVKGPWQEAAENRRSCPAAPPVLVMVRPMLLAPVAAVLTRYHTSAGWKPLAPQPRWS